MPKCYHEYRRHGGIDHAVTPALIDASQSPALALRADSR